MGFIKVIFFVLFTGVTTVFALSNRDVVEVSLYPLSMVIDAPLYVVILGSFAMGVVVYGIGSSLSKFGYERANNMYKKKVEALEHEIEVLKAEQKMKSSL